MSCLLLQRSSRKRTRLYWCLQSWRVILAQLAVFLDIRNVRVFGVVAVFYLLLPFWICLTKAAEICIACFSVYITVSSTLYTLAASLVSRMSLCVLDDRCLFVIMICMRFQWIRLRRATVLCIFQSTIMTVSARLLRTIYKANTPYTVLYPLLRLASLEWHVKVQPLAREGSWGFYTWTSSLTSRGQKIDRTDKS